MGPKDAPCEHPSPAKTSAFAASAFIFPRRRSHFSRIAFGLPLNDFRTRPVRVHTSAPSFTVLPRSHRRPRMAFGDAHEDFGLPQQQLSTMGYPRKSYPHRCSPPCAKRSRPRACARVYIIRSPVGRSPGVSAPLWGRGRAVVAPCPAPACAGWGRAKAKSDAPSHSAPHFPCLRPIHCLPTAESQWAKAEVHKVIPAPARAYSPRRLVYGRTPARLRPNHCVQRRKCTRQSPPLPVRSPRVSLPTAEPPPLVCRITVHKGGSAQGNPRSCPCVLPASACLRPCTLPADGRSADRRWGRAKAKADAPSHSAPHLPA